MSDDQLRALRLLARHPGGCAEAVLVWEIGLDVLQSGNQIRELGG